MVIFELLSEECQSKDITFVFTIFSLQVTSSMGNFCKTLIRKVMRLNAIGQTCNNLICSKLFLMQLLCGYAIPTMQLYFIYFMHYAQISSSGA